jgi:hypothetical protein
VTPTAGLNSKFIFFFFCTGEKRNACRILVGKQEGKRPLGRRRRRWQDSIKIDLRETGWSGMNRIDLAEDRDQWRTLVKAGMNIRVS